MKTVRYACQLQPNVLSVKLRDQIEGKGTAFFDRIFITQGI